MIHFVLLDEAFRFIYISSLSAGIRMTHDELIGSLPWAWVGDDANILKQAYEDARDGGAVFAFQYEDPGRIDLLYAHRITPIRDLFAMQVVEFPAAVSRLSKKQREMLFQLGSGKSMQAIANALSIQLSAAHARREKIMKTLDLDRDEIFTIARDYVCAANFCPTEPPLDPINRPRRRR